MPDRTYTSTAVLRHWAPTCAAVLVLLFLMAACGSDPTAEGPTRDRPTPEATAPPTQEADSPTPGERPTTPAATASPTSTSAPPQTRAAQATPAPSITGSQETPPPTPGPTTPPGPVATVSAPVDPEVNEREALVALYDATGGESWTVSDNWLSDRPIDEWCGVTTGADGRVLQLLLRDNGLSGELPPVLGDLSSLVNLWLPENDLSGGIPPGLGNLFSLEQLNLSDNQLAGELPPELGHLSRLNLLDISSNGFSGGCPHSGLPWPTWRCWSCSTTN